MRKSPFPFIILLFQIHTSAAQPSRIDKNIVMDYFQNMQYEDAIGYLLTAEQIDSSNLQLLGYLGYAYHMNEDADNAGKYYQKMLNIDSNNVSANQYFSGIYSNAEPEMARSYMYRLIKTNPQKAIYYRKMGDLFRRSNKKDSAFAYYEQAFRLSPGDNRNGAALADLLIDQKNYGRADSIIDDGLAKDSLSILYLKLRVKSSYDAAAYKQVLIPGERLMRLGEGSASVITQVALAYYNLKMYNDCIRVCNFLIDKGMAGENLYYYSAKAHAKLHEYEISNELLRNCLDLAISKTAEWYFDALGGNYQEMKQYKKAIAQYDTAFYLFKNPLMLYNCGWILDGNLNNSEAAKKYFIKYMRLAKPQSEDEKKAYNYIRRRYYKK